MTKTFSPEVSKRFKDFGIEVGSESGWYWSFIDYNHQPVGYELSVSDGDFSAYTLQDLPCLLEELGKKKGWKTDNVDYPKYYFRYICELYAEHRELGEGSECEKYLLDLMK